MLVSALGWIAVGTFSCTMLLCMYAWSIAPHSRTQLWDVLRTRHFRVWIRLGAPDRHSEFFLKGDAGYQIDELDKELGILKDISDPEPDGIIADLVRQNRFNKRFVLPAFLVTISSFLGYILLSSFN
jgi:hypothetical protein